MEISVLNRQGQDTGAKVTLADDVFAIEPSNHAIWLDVRLYQANQRQGTHKVKGRGEVQGSTKKPYKQKGTGNARQGHKRSPLHRHGGTIHGPVPHLYDFKVNRKVKQLARRSAWSYKAQQNLITVLEPLQFAAPRTKEFVEVLSALNMAGNKVLFVTGNQDQNIFKSGRNIPRINVLHVNELSTFDILNAERVVLLQDAIDPIHEQLAV